MKSLVLLSMLGCALAATTPTGGAAASAPVYGPWTGPFAATVGAGVNGQIIPVEDTLDVKTAVFNFNNEFNAALRRNGHVLQQIPNPSPFPVVPAPEPRWVGPLAATIPAGLPGSGPVADTAEVAAATAAFNQAYAAAVLANTPAVVPV